MSIVAIISALNNAVDAMPGLVPGGDIVAFDGRTAQTAQPHGLVTGMNVTVSGSPVLDGVYNVQTLSPTAFALSDASGASVVKPAAPGGTVKANLTVRKNVGFDPVQGAPWQKLDVVFAQPEEFTMGQEFYREIGFMQLTLFYPLQQGEGPAMLRAQLIRKTFPRGASFSNQGITVHVSRTAQIVDATPLDENFAVVVRVPFYADVHTN